MPSAVPFLDGHRLRWSEKTKISRNGDLTFLNPNLDLDFSENLPKKLDLDLKILGFSNPFVFFDDGAVGPSIPRAVCCLSRGLFWFWFRFRFRGSTREAKGVVRARRVCPLRTNGRAVRVCVSRVFRLRENCPGLERKSGGVVTGSESIAEKLGGFFCIFVTPLNSFCLGLL